MKTTIKAGNFEIEVGKFVACVWENGKRVHVTTQIGGDIIQSCKEMAERIEKFNTWEDVQAQFEN